MRKINQNSYYTCYVIMDKFHLLIINFTYLHIQAYLVAYTYLLLVLNSWQSLTLGHWPAPCPPTLQWPAPCGKGAHWVHLGCRRPLGNSASSLYCEVQRGTEKVQHLDKNRGFLALKKGLNSAQSAPRCTWNTYCQKCHLSQMRSLDVRMLFKDFHTLNTGARIFAISISLWMLMKNLITLICFAYTHIINHFTCVEIWTIERLIIHCTYHNPPWYRRVFPLTPPPQWDHPRLSWVWFSQIWHKTWRRYWRAQWKSTTGLTI